jgi:glycosyltransferase involved in cell wall biosynthesis
MKILYFSPHPHINLAAPSGPGTHMREVIAGFESEGHTVVRFIEGGETLGETGHAITFKKRAWKKLIPSIVWETLRDLQMMRLDKSVEARLSDFVELEKPDLIYERSCYGMGAGMRTAKRFGIRYVVEMNAPYPEEKAAMQGKSLIQYQGTQHEKEQVLSAYRTIVVSSAMKKYLVEKTNVDPDKILVVANAVNPSHLKPNEAHQHEISARYALKSEHVVFGFVGSIFPYHGVDFMIESFATIEREYEEARMLIVGAGEVLPDLQHRVLELGLEKKIHFTGNVPHLKVYDYLSLMDITIMARSNWYGSPVKIFEYGAMRKAIIAPNVVPVQDVMQHREHGLLIEASAEALTQSMRFMLQQPEERTLMADSFYKKVMEEHTWEMVSKQILRSCQ